MCVREPLDQLDRLLSTEEVAEYLGVGQATVYRWCREGSLPAVKIGRRWRVRRWALEGVCRGAGQPVGRRPGSRVDGQGGRRFLPDSGGTRRDDGQVPARRAAAALHGGGTREARARGARRRRSGGRWTLALRNGGRRAGQPGRRGAAAGRGGEWRGPLRVDQHELGPTHGGQGGAAAAAGFDRTGRGLGAGRQDNGAGGGP